MTIGSWFKATLGVKLTGDLSKVTAGTAEGVWHFSIALCAHMFGTGRRPQRELPALKCRCQERAAGFCLAREGLVVWGSCRGAVEALGAASVSQRVGGIPVAWALGCGEDAHGAGESRTVVWLLCPLQGLCLWLLGQEPGSSHHTKELSWQACPFIPGQWEQSCGDLGAYKIRKAETGAQGVLTQPAGPWCSSICAGAQHPWGTGHPMPVEPLPGPAAGARWGWCPILQQESMGWCCPSSGCSLPPGCLQLVWGRRWGTQGGAGQGDWWPQWPTRQVAMSH